MNVAISGEELQKQLSQCWAVQDVCIHYGVTPMAVHLWRNRLNDPLPAVVIPGHGRPAVRFVPTEVKTWCKRNNINPKT